MQKIVVMQANGTIEIDETLLKPETWCGEVGSDRRKEGDNDEIGQRNEIEQRKGRRTIY